MKTRLLCVALLLGTTSIVRADEIADLKAATQKLAKQNQELAAKLAAVEKRQRKTEAKVDTKKPVVSADASVAPAGYGAAGQWTAADLARHIVNPADDHSLTFFGVTLYGNIDGGITYETHGATPSPSYGAGLNYLTNKANFNPLFAAAPNALSNSALGIKANQEVLPGISVVGQVEIQVQPFSGQLQNGPESLVANNGKTIAAGNPGGAATYNDSSKAGNFSQLWGGLSSPVYGTLTFGRQNSLGSDQNAAYDPIPGGGNAFGLFGNSGTYGSGFGSTEAARLDNSFKYRNTFGPVRVAAAYKFDQYGQGGSGQAFEGGLGVDYKGFSFDATGGKIYNAIAASSLSLANVNSLALNPSAYAAQGNGLVNATISDNTAFELSAKYVTGPYKFFGGYQYVRYTNPSNPWAPGNTGGGPQENGYVEGNYGIYALTTTAYTTAKVTQVAWVGAQYSVFSNFDVAFGYYRVFQNAYTSKGVAPTFTGSGADASNNAGHEDVVSLLFDYHLTKRVDLYAGASLSVVHGGLANGYASGSKYGPAGDFDPTAGVRYQF